MSRGALRTDSSEAESVILNSVREWAQDAGLMLSSVKPERAEKEKQFMKITFRANATGNIAAISRFMWSLQTSKAPIRVTDLS